MDKADWKRWDKPTNEQQFEISDMVERNNSFILQTKHRQNLQENTEEKNIDSTYPPTLVTASGAVAFELASSAQIYYPYIVL